MARSGLPSVLFKGLQRLIGPSWSSSRMPPARGPDVTTRSDGRLSFSAMKMVSADPNRAGDDVGAVALNQHLDDAVSLHRCGGPRIRACQLDDPLSPASRR